jgi:hypothetical protein
VFPAVTEGYFAMTAAKAERLDDFVARTPDDSGP